MLSLPAATKGAAAVMPDRSRYDAVVIGAGPNGLAAAITLARSGCSVVVYEAADTIGGGTRTKDLTLPGFRHDVCSTIHPLALASPFFRSVPLADYGVEWVQPEIPLAHPLPDGSAAAAYRSLEATGTTLGPDAEAWRRLFGPLVAHWETFAQGLLAPLRPLWQMRHPFASLEMALFGLKGFQSVGGLARRSFHGKGAPALLAGMAAHSMQPLDQPLTAAVGLLLGMTAHTVGWPVARGGSQTISDALAAYLRSLGGEIITGARVASLDELPPASAILADVTPRQLLWLAGDRLPERYQRQLRRYRYGPGVFKIDYALDGPIPWTAEEPRRAGTVHVGGTLPEMATAEREVWAGIHPERPFILLAQQSVCDPTRAPAGQQTVWAYCHVPSGSDVDMTARVEAQIERFAPGFRERTLARHTMTAAEMEAYNPNYIGGDINGGVQDLFQHFTRPVVSLNPYATPVPGLFLCSSATPPGGGVHGMCGYYAAQAALRSALSKQARALVPASGA
jgi:phytoene dehydrogenase-like protein